MEKRGMLFFGVLWVLIFWTVPVSAFELPDTGITKCYDNEEEITCPEPGQPFYGQDAQYNGPQLLYRDNGNGTVTDLNTGLMWQQGDSQNDAGGRTWQEACDYCENLILPSGGYSDWRLPNRRELFSIVHYGRYTPAIDTTYFPNCQWSWYWSSSASAASGDEAWMVNFYTQWVQPLAKDNDNLTYVRCVRGGTIPAPAFHDNGDGTVTDSTTGLVWQKREVGALDWEDALDYCECLTLGNRSDWRLPNIRELETLVDWERSSPAANLTYFPNCQSSQYWSSSTRMSALSQAFVVWFDLGIVRDDDKGFSEALRCVAGGPLEHYVEPLGVCDGLMPCYATIRTALNAAADGAVIKVQQDQYPEIPVWSKPGTVTISGGWDSTFASQTGSTEMYAPQVTGGGRLKVQPNIAVIAKP